MKKKIIIASCGVVALCAVIGVSAWFLKGNNPKSENVVYVNTVESILGIGAGNGMQNRYAGVVESQEDWKIEKADSLVVEEILVKEGDEVEEGTPLVRYNMENIENDLSQAKLELERLNNDITNAKGQVTTLEKEKKAASADAKLDYTIRIQTTETEIKKNEYEKKSKEANIKKLEESLQNATVNSKIKGVVKKINKGDAMSPDATDNALITILKTGDLRIKGIVNEQNKSALTEGASLIIHSRIDEERTWKGTITKIDLDAPINNNNNNGMMMMNGSDNTTQSSSYPFYVEIESAQDLMLGQHVFIELDLGQEDVEEKEGIWLDEYFIVDVDSKPYVWADNGKGKLEKKYITLGEKDEDLFKYQVTEGIKEEDKITFPEEGLEEGMSTQISDSGQLGQSNPENADGETNGMEMEGGQMEGGQMEGDIIGGSEGAVDIMPDESDGTVEAIPDASDGTVEVIPDASDGTVEVIPDGGGAVMEQTPTGGVG